MVFAIAAKITAYEMSTHLLSTAVDT